MRRTHGHASSFSNIGNLEINVNKHFAAVDEKPASLTHKEYQIPHLLSVRKGAILNKDIFLSHLYGGIDEPESKIIDVFICKLRKKTRARWSKKWADPNHLGLRICIKKHKPRCRPNN